MAEEPSHIKQLSLINVCKIGLIDHFQDLFCVDCCALDPHISLLHLLFPIFFVFVLFCLRTRIQNTIQFFVKEAYECRPLCFSAKPKGIVASLKGTLQVMMRQTVTSPMHRMLLLTRKWYNFPYGGCYFKNIVNAIKHM